MPPRCLFVVNDDRFFLSHRLPLGVALRACGAEVWVAGRDLGRTGEIEREGLRFADLRLQPTGRNPLADVRTIAELRSLYRRLRPDVIHHVSAKPILYGSIAARSVPDTPVINALTGMGHLFARDGGWSPLAALTRMLYRSALRRPGSVAIFQNRDDLGRFTTDGIVTADSAVLIRGSGVDVDRYVPVRAPDGPPIVMLPARMLADKGVREFVAASRALSGYAARFVLVGGADHPHPAAIGRDELAAWVSAGVVEWWGHRHDMPEVLAEASVVVLPSYREGLPKVLLEAGACGRPVVTTDVPGCREIGREGVNALLVPPRDAEATAAAIARLLDDPELRRRLGEANRRIVVDEFRVEVVVAETMALYERVTGGSLAAT